MQLSEKDMVASERLIRSLANKVTRRISAVQQGVLSREDIEQELWIAWCKARDNYSPDFGVPFQAYLVRGMKNHINRIVNRQVERFEDEYFGLSLERPLGENAEDGVLGDVIASDDDAQVDILERENSYETATAMMSPRARQFVTILRDQPQIVLNEVLVGQDKAEHAKKLGAPFMTPHRLTTSMVFDLIGATRSERNRIAKEIKEISRKVSGDG